MKILSPPFHKGEKGLLLPCGNLLSPCPGICLVEADKPGENPLDELLPGSRLACAPDSGPGFLLTGRSWVNAGETRLSGAALPADFNNIEMSPCIQVLALDDILAMKEPVACEISRSGWSLACITLSDSRFLKKGTDKSGPMIRQILEQNLEISLVQNYLLPDDAASLKAILVDLACYQRFDLIISTGGTGIGPRDITPQTTEKVLDALLPGFMQAMTAASLAHTPRGIISRACAGILNKSIIINLPGSPKAIRENLEPLLPALDHALLKIHGDPSQCGS